MRKTIGEMDNLVAQLSSELKFIKNGMILAFFKKKVLNLIVIIVTSCMLAVASLVILKEHQMLGMSM